MLRECNNYVAMYTKSRWLLMARCSRGGHLLNRHGATEVGPVLNTQSSKLMSFYILLERFRLHPPTGGNHTPKYHQENKKAKFLPRLYFPRSSRLFFEKVLPKVSSNQKGEGIFR
jgi:hypothetical protein